MKLGKDAQTVIRSLILRSGRRISGSQLLRSIDDARGKAICDPSIGASHRSETGFGCPLATARCAMGCASKLFYLLACGGA